MIVKFFSKNFSCLEVDFLDVSIIQSIISRALDSGKLALMSSIDLSAAFDLVNV